LGRRSGGRRGDAAVGRAARAVDLAGQPPGAGVSLRPRASGHVVLPLEHALDPPCRRQALPFRLQRLRPWPGRLSVERRPLPALRSGVAALRHLSSQCAEQARSALLSGARGRSTPRGLARLDRLFPPRPAGGRLMAG
jgi:hypothetical protein